MYSDVLRRIYETLQRFKLFPPQGKPVITQRLNSNLFAWKAVSEWGTIIGEGLKSQMKPDNLNIRRDALKAETHITDRVTTTGTKGQGDAIFNK